jgi:hypothetical protein
VPTRGGDPAFSQATRALVRFGVKARAERVPDALTATRVIFLGIVYALFMFLLVLAFIEPAKGSASAGLLTSSGSLARH